MIIPYFADNLAIDFSCAAPVINEKSGLFDVEMYIHQRVCLLFRDIWSVEKEAPFDIKGYMDSMTDLDITNIANRMDKFRQFKTPRVKRRFDGSEKPIFFDEEEIQTLAKVFSEHHFTAILEVVVDGVITSLEKLDPKLYKIVKPFLLAYNAVEMIGPDDYLKLKSIKRAQIVGGKKMDKKEAALKAVGGALLAGGGIGIIVLGVQLLKEGILGFQGKIQNIELMK